MNTLRIGIIGAGANTRSKHIPLLRKIERVEIVAVCNRSEESGKRVADEFGIPDVMTDWNALVGRQDLDAVVIGTWPYMHAKMTIAALNAGKHVLCEARMAMNAAEARAMHRASMQTDRIAQIVPSPMMLRAHQVIRSLISERAIGQVREISVRGMNAQFADPATPIHWRQRRELSGLNILNMGICYEMLARYLGHAKSVQALTRIWVPERPAGNPSDMDEPKQKVDVPDSVLLLVEMQSGSVANYHLSGAAMFADPPRVTMFGSEGTLAFDLSTEKVYLAKRGDTALVEVPVPPEKAGGWRVEEDFVDSIRNGTPVTLTSFSDGVRYMEFTEAVHLAATTGKRIAIAQ